MATLEGQTIVVVGGSSGIGFSVAKLSLLSLASHVIVSSSSETKVKNAVERLEKVIADKSLPGRVSGTALDVKDLEAVKDYFAKVGEIDHLIWTSGDSFKLGFADLDIPNSKGIFDVRFWGSFMAAQQVKIKSAGSIILTNGIVSVKPRKDWSLVAGMGGAIESVARGLAVDLAPVRVNVICPGFVDTEGWDSMPPEIKKEQLDAMAKLLLVKHIATPDEIAEAYLFVMKCNYITGQMLELDGGLKFT